MIGKTISHYRITEQLGAGGMGEVYRAKDTTLDRQVAIKVLPDIFAGDPERLARFEREAKLLASLNHPNIAAIHGLEEAGGKRFLVLELVEGETLAQRIAKGPLPVDEALEVCRQIAEGLEAAHEKGIIHRDLKPANVKITPEGKVKVLDFGLAKAFHQEAAVADIAQSPTISEAATRAGVILGTAAYMSPEQAKGKPVDKRTDIWAWGCVLYECLTGEKAFQGETVTEIVAAILKGEPDWALLPASISQELRSLLLRCLQKEPRDRVHDIADAKIELEQVNKQPSTAEKSLARPWNKALALFFSMILGAAAMWTVLYSLHSTRSDLVVRLCLNLPEAHRLTGGDVVNEDRVGFGRPGKRSFCISPDGQKIVYSAMVGNSLQLYRRFLSEEEPVPIPGTEGGMMPFFSPDGNWIGFFAGQKLKKLSLSGGPPVPLCDARPTGASWGRNGKIVFTGLGSSQLYWISPDGGSAIPLTKLQKPDDVHILPEFLPNGKAVLYTLGNTASTRDGNWTLMMQSVETGEQRTLVEDAADPRWLDTGHLLFARRGSLMAVPFNAESLQLTGTPVPVMENLMQAQSSTWLLLNLASAQYAVSDSGTLLYIPGGICPDRERQFMWVDFRGTVQALHMPAGNYSFPRLSKDGSRVCCVTVGREWTPWVFSLSRGDATKLSFGGSAIAGIWGPVADSITVSSLSTDGSNVIYVRPANGTGKVDVLTKSSAATEIRLGSWTADGKQLLYTQAGDIWAYVVEDRQLKRLTNTTFNESYPTVSPDGRWIAYGTDETGKTKIYVSDFPNFAERKTISISSGTEPLWAPSGRQLFYRNDDKMMVVDIKVGPSIDAGEPRTLFEGKFVWGSPRSYDIHPDGNRFLMLRDVSPPPKSVGEIHLVQNWFEELKRLVPTGKK